MTYTQESELSTKYAMNPLQLIEKLCASKQQSFSPNRHANE